jgi:transposase InsO family protein
VNTPESVGNIDFSASSVKIGLVMLHVLLVLAHERRKVLHFNITDAPSTAWTAQQMVEAFPFTTPPRCLLRDRDAIYGADFMRRVKNLGLEQKLIAPRAPWQNPMVERLIGSLRRECLDHFIVLNQAHLHRLLKSYLAYYHRHRLPQVFGAGLPGTACGGTARPGQNHPTAALWADCIIVTLGRAPEAASPNVKAVRSDRRSNSNRLPDDLRAVAQWQAGPSLRAEVHFWSHRWPCNFADWIQSRRDGVFATRWCFPSLQPSLFG